ncbi:sigma-54 interaction domain-containing protein [Abyssisolibacter fermentans]|uniref:sigma-54 interaction domain-containing protein n=1 Tax=Abyssisolibacter fermentans TaxID=1766203 RepID=UPI0008314AC7|nr:sigma 54-interacting transcriptional regulator [Abyssisolibacter fermentans]
MRVCFLACNSDKIVFANHDCECYLEETGLNKLSVNQIFCTLTEKFSCDTFSLAGNQCLIFCLEENANDSLLEIYEHVLNNLEEGIIISDEKNRVIFINNACETIEGIDRKKCYLKLMEEIYSPTKNTPNLSMHSAVLNTGIASNEYVNQYIVKENHKVMNVIEKMYPVKYRDNTIAVYSIIKNLPIIKKSMEESLELYTHFNKYKYENGTRYNFKSLIGKDISFIESISNAKRIAQNNTTVLIYGETGTGKELFAQSIHNYSVYQNGSFISINCAAVPDTLLESVFFGTVKGSYTGAGNSIGLFEQAQYGTLFLDEINSMDIGLQAKLLKAIETKKIRRLGSDKDIDIHCRIICALNEDPMKCVSNNKLRMDLYYRLSSSILHIPPLRNRRSDIELLSNYFLKKFNNSYHLNIRYIDSELLNMFRRYNWPGNVRELEHVIESAFSIASDYIQNLTLDSIPPYYRSFFSKGAKAIDKKTSIDFQNTISLKSLVDEFEKKIIITELEKNDNNITATARSLSITRQSLQHKIKKYGL